MNITGQPTRAGKGIAMSVNRMCLDCSCLGRDCIGTDNQNWTGCVYRKRVNTDKEPAAYIPVMSREELEDKGVYIQSK
jgi:hypothetical protein